MPPPKNYVNGRVIETSIIFQILYCAQKQSIIPREASLLLKLCISIFQHTTTLKHFLVLDQHKKCWMASTATGVSKENIFLVII